MLAQDVVPSRMARAKAELAGFLDDYGQGRVGLVLFAGQSFVPCPLTLDRGTAQLFLRMAGTDMNPTQGPSPIHLCRCRRTITGRSRWTPVT